MMSISEASDEIFCLTAPGRDSIGPTSTSTSGHGHGSVTASKNAKKVVVQLELKLLEKWRKWYCQGHVGTGDSSASEFCGDMELF